MAAIDWATLFQAGKDIGEAMGGLAVVVGSVVGARSVVNKRRRLRAAAKSADALPDDTPHHIKMAAAGATNPAGELHLSTAIYTDLGSQLKAQRETIDTLHETIGSLVVDKRTSDHAYNTLEDKLGHVLEQMQSVENIATGQKRRIDELEGIQVRHTGEIKRLQTELQQTREELAQAQQERDMWRQRALTAEERAEGAESRAEAAESKVIALSARVAQLEQRIDELERQQGGSAHE